MTAWWEIDTPQLLGAVPKFRAVASPCFSNRPIRCLVGELRQPVKVPNRRPHTQVIFGEYIQSPHSEDQEHLRRAPSRVRITRTVPPGRFVAMRGYTLGRYRRANRHVSIRGIRMKMSGAKPRVSVNPV